MKPRHALFLLPVLALFITSIAQAQVPETFAYQGYLLSDTGAPVTSSLDLSFALYDTDTDGSALWQETHLSVPVSDGLFSVQLGSQIPFEDIGFDAPLWLGVQVDGGAELVPRVVLSAVPYSLRARSLDADALQAGENISIIRIGEALVISAMGSDGAGWQLGGNSGTTASVDFIGTTDAEPFEIRVDGARVMRYEPAADTTAEGPNVVGGWRGNAVAAEVVGATIAGGGDPEGSGTPLPNRVTADYGTIGGGRNNTAGGFGATVSGGRDNTVTGEEATVSGGKNNTASGFYATIGGGDDNTTSGFYATIGGGRNNTVSGTLAATIGGGEDNTASGEHATIGGGSDNTASGDNAMVGGGNDNTASGNYATVGGGFRNAASGIAAMVPGGAGSQARGVFSFAAGRNARAAHEGAFVWSDNRGNGSDSLVSTADNQFLIRATGGVGIGTDSPSSPLTVAGVVESVEGGFRFPDGTVQTTASSSNAGWRLGGNSGTTTSSDFIGTTDAASLEIRAGNARVMRYEPQTTTEGPNVIGGWSGNSVDAGVVGATIAGGGDPDFFGISPNQVTADYGTIGGGISNTSRGLFSTIGGGNYNTSSGDVASTVGGGTRNTSSGVWSTVGGGVSNRASGGDSTVGGGNENTASGDYSTVPGGARNQARGRSSFAAGRGARAAHDGAFVWNDAFNPSINDSLVSTAKNQFLIQARGGVGIGTNRPQADLHLNATSSLNRPHLLLEDNNNTGFARLRLKNTSAAQFWDIAAGATNTELLNFYASNGRGNVMSLRATGDPLIMHNGAKLTEGGTWTNASSRHLKTDFETVDGQDVLARLAQMPVETWRYKAEARARHMGPTAEAFAAAFGLGDTAEAIATVDADGVSLAAIQALYERMQAQEKLIEALVRRLEALEGRQP